MSQARKRQPHGRRGLLGPGGFQAFVPAPLPPPLEWSDGLVAALSAADRATGRLAGEGKRLSNPHLLIRPFVRREAVWSSRIERTQATLGELLAVEAGAAVERSPADSARGRQLRHCARVRRCAAAQAARRREAPHAREEALTRDFRAQLPRRDRVRAAPARHGCVRRSHLTQAVRSGLGDRAGTCIDPRTQIVDGKTICLDRAQSRPRSRVHSDAIPGHPQAASSQPRGSVS
jgi:hypothetical protein